MARIDPVALTADLVRCPSVTPDASGALDVVQAALEPLGFTCHRVTFEGNGGTYPVDNLYARLGDTAPCLLFAGHVDVVPAGDRSRWTVEPFGAEIRDGQLWGRGAVDMKSGVACFVAAVAAYLEAGHLAQGSVALAITGDEEAQSINGTDKLLRWAADRGESWDAALVGEPTSPTRLGEAARIGRRGSLTGRLTVRGRQGHTAYPHRADNAAHRILAALHELATARLDEGTEAFDPSNLQVTSIDIGNPASNVIPGEARAVINIRFSDRHSSASLEAWLRATIAAHADQFDLEIECNAEPFLTRPGRLSETLSAAVEEVTGLRPVLNTMGGTSDARFIHPYCPVVEFGLVGTTMHQSDERVALADIEGLTRIYEAFLRRYLGPA
jgi:succinyl-diaminopimelate desuccinylase